ncbi:MAG: hypothetical protein IJD57_04225 [Candidatus Gastranaerophilales bacterium]|nr:hypothetical protein [Candidatus Gastranaerophilales bacterium]
MQNYFILAPVKSAFGKNLKRRNRSAPAKAQRFRLGASASAFFASAKFLSIVKLCFFMSLKGFALDFYKKLKFPSTFSFCSIANAKRKSRRKKKNAARFHVGF